MKASDLTPAMIGQEIEINATGLQVIGVLMNFQPLTVRAPLLSGQIQVHLYGVAVSIRVREGAQELRLRPDDEVHVEVTTRALRVSHLSAISRSPKLHQHIPGIAASSRPSTPATRTR